MKSKEKHNHKPKNLKLKKFQNCLVPYFVLAASINTWTWRHASISNWFSVPKTKIYLYDSQNLPILEFSTNCQYEFLRILGKVRISLPMKRETWRRAKASKPRHFQRDELERSKNLSASRSLSREVELELQYYCRNECFWASSHERHGPQKILENK